MKQFFIFIIFLVLFQQAHTQLNVSVYWGKDQIELEKYYKLGKDSLIFHELKFYLSDFQFKQESRKHLQVGPKLLDLEDTNSLHLFSGFPVEEYQSIRFHFGLDSSYHVSEIVDGPLNPMNGMYWAWNSGYIQFKCTGTSSLIPLLDKTFEFHLGGYREPFETVESIQLPILGNKLILDIKPFFEQTVDLPLIQRVMIPGKMAQSYCRNLSKSFRSE
ncbi:MAG: hypothetical protein NWR96_09660 [Crocinitomicaceae bacterium]|jgi:hypothetical protein|nr:hypothetical protein [Crocinitomicaceae bacterium]MDP4761891.1 hypothetical protein [Crocinitomicaceae bacterium]